MLSTSMLVRAENGNKRPLEEMVEHALHILAQTARQHAKAKARAEACKHLLKRARSLAVLESEQKTQGLREHEAEASAYVAKAIEELENAIADEQVMRDRRHTAEQYIALYQTISANERARNVS